MILQPPCLFVHLPTDPRKSNVTIKHKHKIPSLCLKSSVLHISARSKVPAGRWGVLGLRKPGRWKNKSKKRKQEEKKPPRLKRTLISMSSVDNAALTRARLHTQPDAYDASGVKNHIIHRRRRASGRSARANELLRLVALIKVRMHRHGSGRGKGKKNK